MSRDALNLRPLLGVLATLTFALSLSASEPETSTFRVLLPPQEGEGAPLSSIAAHIEASVGDKSYKVLEAQPWEQGAGRTVIVLDFAASSPTNHACLIAEAWTALNR